MSDHLTDQLRTWSPGQAMLPPDPDGHNRALDRVAAEHLRAVAPHLAPSAPAPPQPEPVGTLSAVLADVTAERSRQDLRWGGPTHDDEHDIPDWAGYLTEYIRKLLLCGADQQRHRLVQIAALAVAAAQSLDRRRAAPASLAPAPPAEAKGEMSPPHGIICDRCLAGTPHKRDRHCYSIAQLMEHIAALRTRAREAEERAERVERELDEAQEELDDTGNRVWDEVLAAVRNAWGEDRPYNDSPCELIAKIIDERDEAREQREDLANEILAGRSDLAAANARAEEVERGARTAAEACDEALRQRDTERAARVRAETEREAYRQDRDLTAHRLAAAEAEVASLRVEVSRLRLVYDDPSLDATDGAHPAWWRGSDAGVAGAVRIVNEALDGPLPLPGCVGGADLEAVRQRVAALRASVARLVEAGDGLRYRGADPVAHAAWAAAKADAPAKAETPRT